MNGFVWRPTLPACLRPTNEGTQVELKQNSMGGLLVAVSIALLLGLALLIAGVVSGGLTL